jgi:hypothetical protein
MKKHTKKSYKPTSRDALKGWKQIAEFLGEPVSAVQRWASEGMPVHREGRFVATSPEELNVWLGEESGKASSCRSGDHGPYRSVETRPLLIFAMKNNPKAQSSVYSFTTVELKINFLRTVWQAQLKAEGTVVRRGGTIGYVECTITDEKSRLVAKAASTCMVLRGQKAAGR